MFIFISNSRHYSPFFLYKIFPLLETDEISLSVRKFTFLQLCYFLLFSVPSVLFYLLHVSDFIVLCLFSWPHR